MTCASPLPLSCLPGTAGCLGSLVLSPSTKTCSLSGFIKMTFLLTSLTSAAFPSSFLMLQILPESLRYGDLPDATHHVTSMCFTSPCPCVCSHHTPLMPPNLCSHSSLLQGPPNLTCPFRQNPIQFKCHHPEAFLKVPAGSPCLPLFCCSHKYFSLTFAALPPCFIVLGFVKMFFPPADVSHL